jgi:hypothetical protein
MGNCPSSKCDIEETWQKDGIRAAWSFCDADAIERVVYDGVWYGASAHAVHLKDGRSLRVLCVLTDQEYKTAYEQGKVVAI